MVKGNCPPKIDHWIFLHFQGADIENVEKIRGELVAKLISANPAEKPRMLAKIAVFEEEQDALRRDAKAIKKQEKQEKYEFHLKLRMFRSDGRTSVGDSKLRTT